MLGRVYCQQKIDENAEEEQGDEASKSLVVEEPPQVLITFKNMRYEVPTNAGKKAILKDISGYFAPGTLTAIMGPSGCGKTTLLDLLADQKQSGSVGGSVLVNGQPKSQLFRRVAVYVMQFDNLFPNLTGAYRYVHIERALLYAGVL